MVVALGAAAVRAAGWWPLTRTRVVSAADFSGSWLLPQSTAELLCRRHWGGRVATSLVAAGRRYALNDAAAEDGSESTDDLLRRYDRAERTPYLLTLTELSLNARQLCDR